MKVTTILGSPKKKGNTAKVLGWFEDELTIWGTKLIVLILSTVR